MNTKRSRIKLRGVVAAAIFFGVVVQLNVVPMASANEPLGQSGQRGSSFFPKYSVPTGAEPLLAALQSMSRSSLFPGIIHGDGPLMEEAYLPLLSPAMNLQISPADVAAVVDYENARSREISPKITQETYASIVARVLDARMMAEMQTRQEVRKFLTDTEDLSAVDSKQFIAAMEELSHAAERVRPYVTAAEWAQYTNRIHQILTLSLMSFGQTINVNLQDPDGDSKLVGAVSDFIGAGVPASHNLSGSSPI